MTTLELTPEAILENWHTHGALWLMEDPDLLETHTSVFCEAIEAAKKEHSTTFLVDMSHSSVIMILQAVARNQYTPAEILPFFLHHEYCVAQLLWNPASSSEMIEAAFYTIRRKYFMNGYLSLDNLENHYFATAQHPNSSAKILDYAARLTGNTLVLLDIINHPNTSEETLEWMLTTPQYSAWALMTPHSNVLVHQEARKKLKAMGITK